MNTSKECCLQQQQQQLETNYTFFAVIRFSTFWLQSPTLCNNIQSLYCFVFLKSSWGSQKSAEALVGLGPLDESHSFVVLKNNSRC